MGLKTPSLWQPDGSGNIVPIGTLNVKTTGTSTYDSADWTGGNVIYVPLTKAGKTQTEILNEAIVAATAGDTLILASGTYTTTSAILVTKSLNIKGQSVGATTITSAAAASSIFYITASNVRASDLTVYHTGTGTANGIATDANRTGIVLKDLIIIIGVQGAGTAGTKICIYAYCSSVSAVNVHCYPTSSDDSAFGFRIDNDNAATINMIVNVIDCVIQGIGGPAANSRGFYYVNNNDANTITSYVSGSLSVVTGGGTNTCGAEITSTTTNTITAHIYNSTLSGSTYDIKVTNPNVMNLYGCILVNGTSLIVAGGVINYLGTSVSKGNINAGALIESGIVNKAFADTGYIVASTIKYVNVDATGGVTSIVLPPATGSGRVITIKKIDASASKVTITADATGTPDTINGATTKDILNRYDSVTIHDSAVNVWYITTPPSLWQNDIAGTISPVGGKNFLLPVVPHATYLSNATQTVISTAVAYPVLFESAPDILGLYRAGGTVNIDSASPCTVTCDAPASLIITAGTPIKFTVLSDETKGITKTSGSPALPTIYYVTNISGATFQLSSTIALARAGTANINTSGAITGTYECVSRMYFPTAGDYEIIVSALLDSTSGGGTQQMDIWFVKGNSVADKTGTLLADSNTRCAIVSSSVQYPIAVPFIVDVLAGDFIRLDYHGDATTVRFPAFAAVAASGSTPEIPACPSIILTAKMIGI